MKESSARSDRGTTDRGQKTRERLVQAARKVFEKKGFLAARVADIARAARVAHGTFYTYFTSKEDVFREVIKRVNADAISSRSTSPGDHETPEERIARGNRSYFDFYRRNATMMAILEQVASFNTEFAEFRREMRREANARSARAISHWQQEGRVASDLDARYLASALGSMVDRSCFVWFVLGEPFDEERALETLDHLCIRGLGLDHRPAVLAKPRATS